MSVERMKLLSITGKSDIMNNFLIEYIINSGLQLEDAIKVYEKSWKLTYFEYNPKQREILKNTEKLMKKLGIEYSKECSSKVKIEHSINEIEEKVNSINNLIENITNIILMKQQEIKTMEENQKTFQKLIKLNINLEKLYNLKYMRFRYGKISKENYESIEKEKKI